MYMRGSIFAAHTVCYNNCIFLYDFWSFIDVDIEYLVLVVPTYIYIHMYIHMYICTENTVTDGPKFLCFLYNYVLVLV